MTHPENRVSRRTLLAASAAGAASKNRDPRHIAPADVRRILVERGARLEL